MQSTLQDTIPAIAREDYVLVKSFLQKLGVPFYDAESRRHVNSTPILDITDEVAKFVGDGSRRDGNRFYLKLEYKNQLTKSVKGRAVASMVLNAIQTGDIYNKAGARKRWIEPTSGNTGKGLAEIANLLGVEFTAVFSRLDVSEEIKAHLARFGANTLAIGSEYSIVDLEALAQNRGKTVTYYWSNFGGGNQDIQSLVSGRVADARAGSNQETPSMILKEIDGQLLLETLLPLALEAMNAPIISRARNGDFYNLKKNLLVKIPELSDTNKLIAFVCSIGNTSMLLSTLLNQLGFTNVCSVQGGVKALQTRTTSASNEYCPVPGASITKSSIEFVKKLVHDYPEEYLTFMQYDNADNVRAHLLTTGPELQETIKDLDYVVCTFGSGGTASGLAQYFSDKKAKVLVAFPDRLVEGIRTLNAVEGLAFYRPELYGQVIKTDTSDLERALSYFAKRDLGFGPSTAVALLAAVGASADQRGKSFVIIAADGIENYESEYRHIL
jgi:cysteine synthase